MVRICQITAMPSQDVLAQVHKALQDGGVLALPTETFYGLAASPFDAGAVERIAQIKGRSERKPILILIAEPKMLAKIAETVPPAAQILMQQFWPGPLTIVLPAARSMPRALTAGTGTVGVRQPHYPLLNRILQQVGPVTGTSANRSGAPPARTAEEVRDAFGDEVDLIVDGGETPGGEPSTVVSVVGTVHLLREGRIGRGPLAAALAQIGVTLG
jgi:L-threonylcarbamoyladenylate synthase